MKAIKIRNVTVGITGALSVVLFANAQVAFQDLNFEAATPSTPISGPIGPFYQPTALALPGWNVYLGITPQTEVLQNTFTAGAGSVDLLGPNALPVGYPAVINGNYSVMLQAGPPGVDTGNASIEQTGAIPLNDRSIEWKAWNYNSPASVALSVSFAGHSLSSTVLGSGENYTLYGADISAFAGQTGPLEFTSVFNFNYDSWIELDDISFSTTAVPEPNTLILTGVAGVLFAAHRRYTKRP